MLGLRSENAVHAEQKSSSKALGTCSSAGGNAAPVEA